NWPLAATVSRDGLRGRVGDRARPVARGRGLAALRGTADWGPHSDHGALVGSRMQLRVPAHHAPAAAGGVGRRARNAAAGAGFLHVRQPADTAGGALEMVRRHRLKTLDAMHLAAAVSAVELAEPTEGFGFATVDAELE